ncbi:MAG: c-type cytochrome domain-containing protein [Candidatus Kryptoniota bacterium]
MKRWLWEIGLLSIVAFVYVSCKNTVSGPNGQTSIVFPPSNVSYIKYVQPLFNIDCNYSGCHDSGTRAGGLDLTDYNSAMSVPGVIVPGNSKNSILVQRITGALPIMPPPPLPTLTPNQIQGIKTWIDEGAKDN